MTSGAENDLWTSSTANMTPVSGAWNAAAMPAPEPQVTRRRRSPSVEPAARATAVPQRPPSMTEGPSRPRERPPRAQSTPSENLAAMVRAQGICRRPRASASIWGMPDPELVGAQRTRAVTAAQRTTMTATHPATAKGFPAAAAVTERMVPSARLRAAAPRG